MENNLPKGFFFSRAREGAPDFVKGKLGIKVADAIEFLKINANSEGFVNMDLLVSKDGKPYLKLNDWKPEAK